MPPVSELTQQVPKQQLGNFIFNLQAEEFPFSSMIGKGVDVGRATFEETVSRRAKRGRTGVPNGKDVDEFFSVTRAPVLGYIQEFRSPYGTDQRAAVTEYGGVAKGQEHAWQKVQAMLILRQIMEANFLSDDEMRLATETLGYEARGAFKWLSPTAQSVNEVPEAYRPSEDQAKIGTTVAAVTEAILEGMIDATFRKRLGGKVKWVGLLGELLQAKVNKFSVVADTTETSSTYPTRLWNQEKGVVMRAVRRLEFSNGSVDLMPSAHIMTTKATGEDSNYTTRSGLFIERDVWSTKWQKRVEAKDLTDEGGGPRGFYSCMCAVFCGMPAHNGCITAAS